MANLIIVCGLPGSGKTTVAKKLAKKTRGALLRTDIIRKKIGKSGYSEREKQAVYREMLLRAEELLKIRKTVVLDATFAKKKNRRAAEKIAKKLKAAFYIIEVVCPPEIVQRRLRERKGDASLAGFKHYLEHKEFFEPLDIRNLRVDTSRDIEQQLEKQLEKLFQKSYN